LNLSPFKNGHDVVVMKFDGMVIRGFSWGGITVGVGFIPEVQKV
jgi:hypothetical protein